MTNTIRTADPNAWPWPKPDPGPVGEVEFSYNPQDTLVMQPGTMTVKEVEAGPSVARATLVDKTAPQGSGYVFPASDPRYRAANAFASAARTIEVFEQGAGTEVKWAFRGERLKVVADRGEMLNAFYSRRNGNINFFHTTDPITGQVISSANSGEVVSHETGHAILDGLRPGYMQSWSPDPGAFHESFGDVVAMLVSLHDERVLDVLMQETGGDLSRPNSVARLGEEMGRTINHTAGRDVTGGDFTRNALNSFVYQDPSTLPELGGPDELGREIHSFSRLWTGAMYQVLQGLVEENSSSDRRAAVREAAGELLRMYGQLMRTAPQGDFTFPEMAVALMQADREHNQGRHAALLTRVLKERKLLEESFSEPGAARREFAGGLQTVTVPLPGDLGPFTGARVEVLVEGADAAREFHDQGANPKTERALRNVKDLIARGRILYATPDQVLSEADYFDAQGQPYAGVVRWLDGGMTIERVPIMAMNVLGAAASRCVLPTRAAAPASAASPLEGADLYLPGADPTSPVGCAALQAGSTAPSTGTTAPSTGNAALLTGGTHEVAMEATTISQEVADDPALGEHRPGEVIVRLRPRVGEIRSGSIEEDYGLQRIQTLELPGVGLEGADESLLHLKLPPGASVEEAIATLSGDARVAYAVPNHVYYLQDGDRPGASPGHSGDSPPAAGATARTPDDLDERLWGLRTVHAPEAWAVTTGSRQGPLVAMLDTGVDYRHPDLAANLWTNPGEIPGNGVDDDGNGVVDDLHGYYPARDSGDPMDGQGHGSHTAGTVAAVGNNGQGVVGLNWEAQVMAIKIFDDQGRTDAAHIIKGMAYAAKMGARITSNSWGGTRYNQAIFDAFAACPALHVAAAGNSQKNTDLLPHYPSCFDLPNVVSVAAVAPNDSLAYFSNYGAESVDLAAPGTDILSLAPGGGYKTNSGTSMACPHVTGVAALIATRYPTATNEEIKRRLLFGSDRVPDLEGKVTYGRLNAARSLADDQAPPGAPRSLRAEAASPQSVSLSWKAPGDDGQEGTASAYELRYSMSPIRNEEDFARAARARVKPPAEAGSRERVTLALEPSLEERHLHLALKAYDKVGNASPLALAETTLPAARTLFDGTSAGDWNANGTWGQVEVDGRRGVWTDSPGGDYRNNTDTWLESRAISLRGARDACLVFESKRDIAQDTDFCLVQASRDGRNWKNLSALTDSAGWARQVVDLSDYDGKKVHLRFLLHAGGTGTADGVYFDKVAVLARES